MVYFLGAMLIVSVLCFVLGIILLTERQREFDLLTNAVPFSTLCEELKRLAYLMKDTKHGGEGINARYAYDAIKKAFRMILKKNNCGNELFEFERWIYENYFILTNHKKTLLANPFRHLPHIDRLPRIYYLARHIVQLSEARLDRDTLSSYLRAFLSECLLDYCEVKAFYDMLNYALIEYTATLCIRAMVINKQINRAKRFRVEKNQALAKNLSYNSFCYGLSGRLLPKQLDYINNLCGDFDFKDRVDSFLVQMTRYSSLTSATITAIRHIGEIFEPKRMLDFCRMDAMFLTERSGIYAKMSLDTRHDYLQRAEAEARRQKLNQTAYATILLNSHEHIGQRLYKPPLGVSIQRLYLASVFLMSLGLTFLTTFWFESVLLKLIFIILAFPIVLTIVKDGFDRGFKGVSRLPKMDFTKSIPDECSTLIVITELIADKGQFLNALKNAQTVYCANRKSNIETALLLDFVPSKQREFTESEREVIELAKKLYVEDDRVSIFIRKRDAQDNRGFYYGQERKRGAIADLNRYILKNEQDFELCLCQNRQFKYAVVLDADTITNNITELIEIIAHPLNQRYSVVALSVVPKIHDGATFFERIFCAKRGIDSYSFVCQNASAVFGAGNFMGKGIYDIARFDNATARFKRNCILSHDYIEGAFAGTVNSSVLAIDGFPKSFMDFWNRQLRWTRGDWQLLPFLFRRLSNQKNRAYINPLGAYAKFLILCNMVFSVLPISSLALVILSLFCGRLFFVPLILALLPILIALVMDIFTGFTAIGYNQQLSVIIKDRLKTLFITLFFILTMPICAFLNLVAIVKTLIRLLFTKKDLLMWKTFAHSANENRESLNSYLVMFFPQLIFALVLMGWAFISPCFFAYFALSVGFILVVPIAWLLAKSVKSGQSDSDREFVRENARLAFKYFEDGLKEEFNYLISDNYQMLGGRGFAMQTSPTNIGFSLTSIVSAHSMGFIDSGKMRDYLGKILSSVASLEKYKGNLYNWYDIKTKQVLYPRFVSSVDSGNLLSCLLMVRAYLTEQSNCEGLIAQINSLVSECQIEALFDQKKKQFLIGYNESTQQFSLEHYDLMASEALLTYLSAIAIGAVDKECFSALSTRHVKFSSKSLLYSWSGGAFEYLMPMLFINAPKQSLYGRSAINATHAQIRWAKKQGLSIFGVSESQFNHLNEGAYQYKAFGVDGIAIKNSAETALVVSPYSSFLMLSVLPKRALKNLKKMGALQEKYGFVEAVDFSTDKRGQIVDSFMAHHLGMSLLASANFLSADYLKRVLSSQPEFSASLILCNQPPLTERAQKKLRLECKGHADKAYSELVTKQHTEPKLNLLTNGQYSVVTSERGGGYSKYEDLFLTQFNNTRESGGFRVYINKNGTVFDACDGASQYSCGATRSFKSCNGLAIETNTFVLPDIDGEVRSVTIKNLYKKPQRLTVFSVVLPCIAPQNEMLSHPAFSKLFIKTEFTQNCLVAYRKNKQERVYLAHTLLGEFGFESSRYAVFERGEQFVPMQRGKVGDVLDPVLSLNRELNLRAGDSVELNFVLFAVRDRDRIGRTMSLLNGFSYLEAGKEASRGLALSKCTNATEEEKKRRILSRILYESGMQSGGDFKRLESVGINLNNALMSFDFSRGNEEEFKRAINLVLDLYCFSPPFNLAIVYKEERQYFSPRKDFIDEILRASGFYKRIPPNCFVFMFNENDTDTELIEAIRAYAIELSDRVYEQSSVHVPTEIAESQKSAVVQQTMVKEGELGLGIGKLNHEGEWEADLTGVTTPTPFSNIFAGRSMGAIVTESGGGYSYYGNSRENKLTNWSNDPILDQPSEAVYIFEGANSWSITKKPILRRNAKYYVKHGFGYTQFDCDYLGIDARQTVFLDYKRDVKYYELRFKNNSQSRRKLEVVFSLDAVLGDFKGFNKRFFKGAMRGNSAMITNLKSHSSVFVSADCQRQFLSFESGVLRDKKGVAQNDTCDCINYGVVCELDRAEERVIYFAVSPEFVEVEGAEAQSALLSARQHFSTLNPIKIETPDKRLNALFNHWLQYQVICSRFNARAGFYQAGGAIGFRDQLQDCLAVMYHDAGLVRQFIIDASEHQFLDGSVQHWWHPPFLGVKTKISDDLLFLPFVVTEYIAFTGDDSILKERTAYLEDVEIPSGQDAVFTDCVQSQVYGDILQHCERAIDRTLRFGRNGLCLMGSGDWNDAMDKVGHEGEGESVWLSMFLCLVLSRFLRFASKDRRDIYKRTMLELKQSINSSAWDGDWYKRAFYDDGTPLGTKHGKQCRIDLISQAFAVLAEIDSERAKIAMDSAQNRLVDKKRRIVKLLEPPFEENGKPTGYIQHYPEGVRENGGQYTHATAWFIMALLRMGRADEGYSLLKMINPLDICADYEGMMRYKTEPYVLCGDVYHGHDKGGRGGWSWYTGSASWIYKLILEELLGLKKRGKRLYFEPKLPKQWQGCLVKYSAMGIDFEIEIVNEGKGQRITIDGITFNSDYIELNSGLQGKRVIIRI